MRFNLMRMPLAYSKARPLPQTNGSFSVLELSVMSQEPQKARRPDRVANALVLVADVLAFGLTAALMGAAGLASWSIGVLMLAICLLLPFQWAAITYVQVQWWKIDNGWLDRPDDSR